MPASQPSSRTPSLVPRPHPLLINLIAERGPGNTRHKNCRKHPTKTWGANLMAARVFRGFVLKAKQSTHKISRQLANTAASQFKSRVDQQLLRAVDLASEKGTSAWLTALPIEEHGFALHKGAFRDALCLRYGWLPTNLPSRCVCNKPFSVDHARVVPPVVSPLSATMIWEISLLRL